MKTSVRYSTRRPSHLSVQQLYHSSMHHFVSSTRLEVPSLIDERIQRHRRTIFPSSPDPTIVVRMLVVWDPHCTSNWWVVCVANLCRSCFPSATAISLSVHRPIIRQLFPPMCVFSMIKSYRQMSGASKLPCLYSFRRPGYAVSSVSE